MKVAAIIQARMGSTRLPGKVLKRVLGKTLLEFQLERVKRCKTIDEIIVATTTENQDQPIVDLCESLEITCFRGSEHDVLSRYYEAATHYEVDVVVRLTSDCPLIDPEVVDNVVSKYLSKQEQYDYASNTLDRTYPRGLDTEVFSYDSLQSAYNQANLNRDREHVTAYFYTNPNQFRLLSIKHQNNDLSEFRWTVDTIEDFELIEKIISTLYPSQPSFRLEDVIHLLNENPEWNKINANVEQKQM